MKFKKGQRRRALVYEKDLVQYWKDNKTFEKSVEQRPADDGYVFYDGPPFITGVPHHGTLLSSIAKDVVPRYWTMKGKRVERVWGWDCHGLPAEVFTEKKLGIHDKRDIGTKISLETYIETCRDNMVQTGSLWEDTIDRIGRWVNFKGAYKTMDKDYMESVWWAFRQLYDKGKIYEGEKVLLYCVRDATPISKAEVAMDNSYQDVTDPSVFVKFKLKDWQHTDQPVYLLAWTTTPWTLNSNTAVGVGKENMYSLIHLTESGENLIILNELVEKVLTDEKHQPLSYTIEQSDISGDQLIGREYEPLLGVSRGENAHKVWEYPDLSTEEGTGIVHLSPAYGEEDYVLAKKHGIPFIVDIDDNGFYAEGEWKGQYVWDVNKPIAKELHDRGIVWKIEYIRHSYPHCHRCGTKLMYRAHPSWFMDINGQRQQMLEQNENVSWFPEHIKHGRFEKTVEGAPDWNLSRDRFWATAMPVWKGMDAEGNEHIKVVGSYAELKELSGIELEDYHRPWVDDITFTVEGVEYKRIDKVLDCWFESGSMPFAQFHYPFENQEKFEKNYPGDFIVEYVGQVRAWFYYVHAVNVGLFGKNAFEHVNVTGTLAGNDGRKMSKSYGNYTDPNELMDQYSADSLRFLLMSSTLMNGEDFSLQDKDVADTARKLSMVWNMFDFFTLYADVDGWEWNGKLEDPSATVTNPLDTWILSRLHQVITDVDQYMQAYDIPNAIKQILPFIDDASNWYVRRSRRRFWKSEQGQDKNNAYRTLHYILVQLAHVMAPFTPFLAEELYRKLTGGESVHLRYWPTAGVVNHTVLNEMATIRELITQGLSQRAAAGVKVRQPLGSAIVTLPREALTEDKKELQTILLEELNLKSLTLNEGVEPAIVVDTVVSQELRQEGIMREVIRNVQNTRKQAGLEVDDRIMLVLSSQDDELMQAIATFKQVILEEALATEIRDKSSEDYFQTSAKVEGADLHIAIAKTA